MNNTIFRNHHKYLEISNEAKNILKSLDNNFKNHSEMLLTESEFLCQLILNKRPKKILELGVSAGTSSAVILTILKNIPNSKLYSIDLNTKWYKNNNFNTGHYVDSYPELKSNWILKTGNLAYKFMDEIGKNIDFCFIDTVHINPGEILDFLMVIPYLSDDAILVFHDTNLHTAIDKITEREPQYTNCLLMSAISGQKILNGEFNQKENPCNNFSNIAAIQLNHESKEKLWEIFNLLAIKWQYMPTDEQLDGMREHFSRFYDKNLTDYFCKVIELQKTRFKYHKNIDNNCSPKIPKKKLTLAQKIFSVRNDNKHKVIMIFGIKIKFKK